MDFTKDVFIEFENKFGGTFIKLFPDATPVYVDSKENIYKLDNNVEKLIDKSIKDDKNYLISNTKMFLDPEAIY